MVTVLGSIHSNNPQEKVLWYRINISKHTIKETVKQIKWVGYVLSYKRDNNNLTVYKRVTTHIKAVLMINSYLLYLYR